MNKEEVSRYAMGTTTNSYKINFKDGSFKFGFFDFLEDTLVLQKENKWRIIENNNVVNYRNSEENHKIKYTTLINGEDILSIEDRRS